MSAWALVPVVIACTAVLAALGRVPARRRGRHRSAEPKRPAVSRPVEQPRPTRGRPVTDDTVFLPLLPPVPYPAAASGHDTDWLSDQPAEVLGDTLVRRRFEQMMAIEGLS